MDKPKLKAKIEEQIAGVTADIEARQETTKPVEPDVSIGRLTRMDAINDKSVNEATLASLKQTLSQLKLARERVDTDDFGYCVECEEKISEKRLLLMPHVAKCVKCAK